MGPFSELEPTIDEKDAEVFRGGTDGVYVDGEVVCELAPFCWLALPLPFPFALLD